MAQMTSGNLVKNFTIDEMANTLSTETIKLVITPEVVRQAQMMQELREWYNKPMKVNSWYRTKDFNKSVKGNIKSPHLRGTATDIALPNLTEKQYQNFISQWKKICTKYKVIGGCSLYAWGIHFDSGSQVYNCTSFRLNDFR